MSGAERRDPSWHRTCAAVSRGLWDRARTRGDCGAEAATGALAASYALAYADVAEIRDAVEACAAESGIGLIGLVREAALAHAAADLDLMADHHQFAPRAVEGLDAIARSMSQGQSAPFGAGVAASPPRHPLGSGEGVRGQLLAGDGTYRVATRYLGDLRAVEAAMVMPRDDGVWHGGVDVADGEGVLWPVEGSRLSGAAEEVASHLEGQVERVLQAGRHDSATARDRQAAFEADLASAAGRAANGRCAREKGTADAR